MAVATNSIGAAVAANAMADAQGIAFWYGDHGLSWAEFDDRSRRVATGLANQGIGAGDRVALWLPNVPAWMICFAALARLGAIAVASNTRFRSREIGDIWSRAGVKAAVLWPDYRHIDFPDILGAALHELPALQCLIEYSENGSGESVALKTLLSRSAAHLKRVAYADLERSAPLDADAGTPDTPCLTFNTSGTTSKPKLVLHTHGSVLRHAHDVARVFGYVQPHQVTMQLLPFCGTYGFSQTMAAIVSRTPNAVHHTFDPVVAGDMIRRRKVTRAAMNLDLIRRIYEAEPDQVPFPGIRFFVGTHSNTLAAMEQERGFRVQGLYGSSEVQGLYSMQPDVDDPQRRLAYGGVPVAPTGRARARSLTDGSILPPGTHEIPGEAGELELYGPSLLAGYFNDPAATKKAITDDGYFRTGDLGYALADGGFRFITRIGDVLRLSGFLVNPAEIEDFIQDYPGVTRCQVVGVEPDPDDSTVTVPVAFYTGDAGIAEDALLAYCAKGMARYKVPKRILHLDEFPVVNSANNTKVRRTDLRDMGLRALRPGAA